MPASSPRPTRSLAKKRRSTSHSTPIAASHGSAIRAAKRANDSPPARNASRLVRLETGSSNEAELARCVQAYMCGLARNRTRAAVANTTGVNSTTVASRLSAAVTTEPTTKTRPNRATGRPREAAAIHRPAASNSPSRSHSSASTSTAARKATVGPRLRSSANAADGGRIPRATVSSAAGTATSASGRPRGRATAKANVAASNSNATVSASALGTLRAYRVPVAPPTPLPQLADRRMAQERFGSGRQRMVPVRPLPSSVG